jgi:hypothetical protein
MKIIDIHDVDSSSDEELMLHQGKPFTGYCREGRDMTEYLNGKPHGISVGYYEDGQKFCEARYHFGECIEEITWHRNGTKRSEEGRQKQHTIWDEYGNLAYREGTVFYTNGAKKMDSFGRYFSSKGEVAIYRASSSYSYDAPLTFHDEVLMSCYWELLTNEYPWLPIRNFDTRYYDLERYFWQWLAGLDKEQQITILHNVREHPSGNIKAGAIVRLEHLTNTASFTNHPKHDV